LATLAPGQWYEVPNSKILVLADAPDDDDGPDNVVVLGVTPDPPVHFENHQKVENAVSAWSGGALDPVPGRERLLVWGGGHADYAGNEIYAFDLNSLSWQRLTEPVLSKKYITEDKDHQYEEHYHRAWELDFDPLETCGYYGPTVPASIPDEHFLVDNAGQLLGLMDPQYCHLYDEYLDKQQPRARHTYNYLQYVPALDSFCSIGGGGLYKGGQKKISNVDCYNFTSARWERHANVGVDNAVPSSNGFTAVDGAGDVWSHSRDGQLARWNVRSDSWTPHADLPNSIPGVHRGTADIDTSRNVLVRTGNGKTILWDLNQPDIPPTKPSTSGDKGAESGENPGFIFHPSAGLFVGWDGGRDVYTFDLADNRWQRIACSGANPGSTPGTGTYGRFRYIPSKNAFVVVNGVEENVFILKSPLAAAAADDIAPIAPEPLTIF